MAYEQNGSTGVIEADGLDGVRSAGMAKALAGAQDSAIVEPAGLEAARAFRNEALWLTGKRGRLELGHAPYPIPSEHEIVVRNRAVAINPFDWITQSVGDLITPWLRYPFILGTDVAGDVVDVGAKVTRFRIGDRVLGHALGAEKAHNRAAEGGFQLFTVLKDHMAAPIPASLPFEEAAVLPLGLSTAASALFERDQLGLHLPQGIAKARGETLLVWGGATSVGCNAIQLAKAAGYDVITTASPRNFELLRSLGARQVFDYKSTSAVAGIIRALRGCSLAGALAIGIGSTRYCLDIVHACEGNKFVSLVTPPVSFNTTVQGLSRTLWLIQTLSRLLAANLALGLKARRRNIRTKFVWGSALAASEVGPFIYGNFLPKALADGRYRCAPKALIAGHGLAAIPSAMQAQKQGVSARKIVVTL
jgi:NADPH:quinone reductase-like Zn-dependent oxidoreductase